MPMMINLRRAQDQRLALKVAYQAVDLVKKLKMAKKLTCLMIWRTTKVTMAAMRITPNCKAEQESGLRDQRA